MNTLERLMAQVDQAEKRAKAELLRLYPKGSVIHFTLKHAQRNPSIGTVTGVAWKVGYLRVRNHRAKPLSCAEFVSVHYTRVLQRESAAGAP